MVVVRNMIALIALVTVVKGGALGAVGNYFLAEFAFLISIEQILILTRLTSSSVQTGHAVADEEVAILAFVDVNEVVVLASQALGCTAARQAMGQH